MNVSRRMRRSGGWTAAAACLLASTAWADTGAATGTDATGLPGSWQPHQFQFAFLGFTDTYSCDGLSDKLTLLLKLTGARADAAVAPLCTRGFGHPDKMAQARLNFSSLKPAESDASAEASGAWRHVEIGSKHPIEFGGGDCELMEQYRDRVLPLFSTRNIKSQLNCVPFQGTSSWSLSFDVFAPPPAITAAKS